MASRLYKIIKVQIGETEGVNGRANKEWLELGRVIEHEVRGNKWLTMQITAAHLGPVLYQLCKPFMRKGCSSVDGVLYDPPMRKSVPAAETAEPEEPTPEADDWADPDGV